jgi:hypothetical protein
VSHVIGHHDPGMPPRLVHGEIRRLECGIGKRTNRYGGPTWMICERLINSCAADRTKMEGHLLAAVALTHERLRLPTDCKLAVRVSRL